MLQVEREAEVQRQETIKAAYVAAIPDEIREIVDAAVAREVASMKAKVEAEYHAEAAALREQIAALKPA